MMSQTRIRIIYQVTRVLLVLQYLIIQYRILARYPWKYNSTERGEVYVIGEGVSGQLGLEVDEVDHLITVSGLRNEYIIQVAGGGMHTLCLASSGQVSSTH